MKPCTANSCNKTGNNTGDELLCAMGSTETMYYVHKDYLGSISAITDASGNLVESLSYDPWGRRRKATDWTDYNVTSTMFDRGFTGHEHLPHFGLINMNGRVYDPFLARFLSPDPFIQAPSYTQNYNRYSYAWNNPLKYTDPSGYSVILDENTTNIPYIAGGSGFAGNWYAWATDRHSMSGQLHWQAQYRSGATNAALLGQGAFDNFYGKGAYNSMIGSHIDSKKQKNAATGKVSGSGLITDPSSIAMIVDWMKSGFHLSIVSAFGRTTLVGSMGALGSYRYGTGGGLIFGNKTAGMVVGEALAIGISGSSNWASNVDWSGVTNSSLSILAGISEMVIGGFITIKSFGSTSTRSIPLMVDGSYRVTANTIRLLGYLAGSTRFSNAMPSNMGASFGKLIDMSFGASFNDYGYGQAFGGATNDFVASLVTGGTAGPLNNLVGNYNTTNAALYLNAYAGYNSSMFFNFYPLIK